MASILYAEVYLICMIVVGLLLHWSLRSDSSSSTERWLRRTVGAFLCNFASNFLFTLFNGVQILPALTMPASWLFKTLYHMTLCIGVFCWCGFAETEHHSNVFEDPKNRPLLTLPLLLPLLLLVLNLRTGLTFRFTEAGAYERGVLFQFEMFWLLLWSTICAMRLSGQGRYESDPNRRVHISVTASFPLCIAAAWMLSFLGESVPVICVAVMVELLCLFMGTTRQQISMDKLTQVNNRQNLMGFMDYKLKNHDGELYLMMIDADKFKQINDAYGHLEGDNALILVAKSLKRACGSHRKRPYIARYGGDEFIIVLEGSEGEVQALCADIRHILRSLAEDLPYPLSLTIGYARWAAPMKAKDLIAAADEELYRIKKER